MPNFLYSASISGFCRKTSVFEALQEIKQAGYDGVDFPFSSYSRTEGAPLCDDKWWRVWAEAVGDYAEKLSLPVLQAHAPWHQSIAADFHYEAPSYIYARIFEACSIMKCSKLVFHPLQYPYRIVSADTLDAIHLYNMRWFGELLPMAEQYKITIELENTFDYYHLRMPSDPQQPHITAEQLNTLADAFTSDYVKICLDTGHANIAEQDISKMIESFGTRLDCLHLNDNYGKRSGANEDLHLLPGDGNISWKKVIGTLRQTGYSGVINLEIIATLSDNTPEQRIEELQKGRMYIGSLLEVDG